MGGRELLALLDNIQAGNVFIEEPSGIKYLGDFYTVRVFFSTLFQ